MVVLKLFNWELSLFFNGSMLMYYGEKFETFFITRGLLVLISNKLFSSLFRSASRLILTIIHFPFISQKRSSYSNYRLNRKKVCIYKFIVCALKAQHFSRDFFILSKIWQKKMKLLTKNEYYPLTWWKYSFQMLSVLLEYKMHAKS